MNNFTWNMMSNAYQSAKTTVGAGKTKASTGNNVGRIAGHIGKSAGKHTADSSGMAASAALHAKGTAQKPSVVHMQAKKVQRIGAQSAAASGKEISARSKRLQTAFIMAEVLSEPVSKRRNGHNTLRKRRGVI